MSSQGDTPKHGVDPEHFGKLAAFLRQEDLEPYAHRALRGLVERDEERRKGWRISFYTFLVLTILATLLALALSVTAGWRLHPVEMEVVRWSWGASFGGGGATVFSRLKQLAN